MKGRTFWVLALALLAGGGVIGWQAYQARLNALPPGFASGNGRVESVQVDVTTKEPGRVETILVHEGDMVHAGQVVAKMDTVTLEAELARAQANVAEEEAKAPRGRSRHRPGREPAEAGRSRAGPRAQPPCPQGHLARGLRHQGHLGQDPPRGARRREGPAQHGPEVGRGGQGRGGEDPVADRRHDPQVHRRGSRPLPACRGGRGAGQRRQGPHPREPRRCVHGDLPAGPGRREGEARRRRPDRPGRRPRVRRARQGELSSPRRPSSRPRRSRPGASATS